MKKSSSKTSDKQQSKGQRLNWTPISQVTNVRLTSSMLTGKVLTETEIKNRQLKAGNPSLLVP